MSKIKGVQDGAKLYYEIIDGRSVVIIAIAHLPNLEKLDEFKRLVFDFFAVGMIQT